MNCLDPGPIQYLESIHPKVTQTWLTENTQCANSDEYTIITAPFNQSQAIFSKDGPWMAYNLPNAIHFRWEIVDDKIMYYVFRINGEDHYHQINFANKYFSEFKKVRKLMKYTGAGKLSDYHKHDIALYRAISKHPSYKSYLMPIMHAIHRFHCIMQPDKKAEHRRTLRSMKKLIHNTKCSS